MTIFNTIKQAAKQTKAKWATRTVQALERLCGKSSESSDVVVEDLQWWWNESRILMEEEAKKEEERIKAEQQRQEEEERNRKYEEMRAFLASLRRYMDLVERNNSSNPAKHQPQHGERERELQKLERELEEVYQFRALLSQHGPYVQQLELSCGEEREDQEEEEDTMIAGENDAASICSVEFDSSIMVSDSEMDEDDDRPHTATPMCDFSPIHADTNEDEEDNRHGDRSPSMDSVLSQCPTPTAAVDSLADMAPVVMCGEGEEEGEQQEREEHGEEQMQVAAGRDQGSMHREDMYMQELLKEDSDEMAIEEEVFLPYSEVFRQVEQSEMRLFPLLENKEYHSFTVRPSWGV
jgi:hypothetical protein